MPYLFFYLVKFSIAVGCFYLFYYFALRRLTFYHWNRFYLAAYPLVSFFIPFIDVTSLVHHQPILEQGLLNIPTVGTFVAQEEVTVTATGSLSVTYWDVLLFVFIVGVALMVGRLLIQYLSLLRIKNNARVSCEGQVSLYDVDQQINPFSFGNDIYVNRRLHNDDELEKIILHEFVHVKQKHTVDLVIAELLCVVNWFNPFAWLIRKAIRQNLEFIADQGVINSGADARQYQYLLLKVMGIPQYSLTNHFSFSSLKKRIVMMNKIRSAKLHLVKFLFLLPLCAILLIAFRNANSTKGDNPVVKYSAIAYDMKTKLPVKGITVTVQGTDLKTTSEENGYFNLEFPVVNAGVRATLELQKKGYEKKVSSFSLTYSKDDIHSSGIVEILALKPGDAASNCDHCFSLSYMKERNAQVGYEDAKTLLDTYFKGGISIPSQKGDTVPAPAATPPVPPKPSVAAVKQLPSGVKSINITDSKSPRQTDKNKVTVTYKDGKKEVYDMNKTEDAAAFHNKFGDLQPPPPPPPPVAPVKTVAPVKSGVAPVVPVAPVKTTNGKEITGNSNGKGFILSNEYLQQLIAEAEKRGEIFVGMRNRLNLEFNNIKPEDLVLQWDGGLITRTGAEFYASPTHQGKYIFIIYAKQPDGNLKRLQTRYLDAKRLPPPSEIPDEYKLTPIENFQPPMKLWPAGSLWTPDKDNC